MPVLSAEIEFKKGLAALVDGSPREAQACFRRAMDVERRRRVPRPQMRYLSYYGLSLARSGGAFDEACRCCEEAVRQQPGNPGLWLNLVKAQRLAGRSAAARAAVRTGLRFAPSHEGLRREAAEIGGVALAPARRRAPNGVLGRLRMFLGSRREGAPSPSG